MAEQIVPSGVVHELPEDLKRQLVQEDAALNKWKAISSLARNEWICWVLDAKKEATRVKRIGRTIEDLSQEKSRPCCWPGCPHREKINAAKKVGCY